MAFTEFKTLGDVLKQYRIRYAEKNFQITTQVKVPKALSTDLAFTLKNIAYDVSEAAICENLLYPILKSVWMPYVNTFALWSHKPISYDTDLAGIPDYLISKRSDLGKIVFETPYIAVVEAKKDDFSGGWAQCGAEMYAMQKLNQNMDLTIFGIVSNGETWEIAQLNKDEFIFFKNRYDINDLKKLYNALSTLMELCLKQF
jgi:hypothetical protein